MDKPFKNEKPKQERNKKVIFIAKRNDVWQRLPKLYLCGATHAKTGLQVVFNEKSLAGTKYP